MKSKKRVAMIVVLALTGIALIAVPALAVRGRSGGRDMWRGAGRGMGPAFTEEQQEQIEEIHDKYADQRAELTNRLKVIMLETEDMLDDDSEPDFGALEKSIEQTSEIRAELAKLRLRIHKEIRSLLDGDQKVLFDRGLGRMMHGRMGGRDGMPGMSGHRGMRMMGRGQAMCRPGGSVAMGGGMSGHPGMGRGPGQPGMSPWCPFAGDPDDADDGDD